MTGETRASFYALQPGGWRDYVTLLHLPYTLWHLSYVVIGAALAPAWLPAAERARLNRHEGVLLAFRGVHPESLHP
jgi:hypothetical protein